MNCEEFKKIKYEAEKKAANENSRQLEIHMLIKKEFVTNMVSYIYGCDDETRYPIDVLHLAKIALNLKLNDFNSIKQIELLESYILSIGLTIEESGPFGMSRWINCSKEKLEEAFCGSCIE